jgi:serine phosphatase RsbU (regulator of sigma subunit)/CheY-like chemotaxis protein
MASDGYGSVYEQYSMSSSDYGGGSDYVSFVEERSVDAEHTLPPWKILVVDDELDVHKVTRLVLSDFNFAGRSVELISAFTGEQAKDYLRISNDIAIVLLDVVMEEIDTGLRLVEYIRKDLNNNYVRIILRTGQPGQAPEREVIVQYDINDYKSKTELTAEKLVTSIVSCLRSYADIMTIDRNRRGFERVIISSDAIFHSQSFDLFISEVLAQTYEILRSESSFPVNAGIVFASKEGNSLIVKATYGTLKESMKGAPLFDVIALEGAECVDLALNQKMNVYREGFYAGFLLSSNGQIHIIYIVKEKPFDEWEKDLIDIFNANVHTALENLYLSINLERKVEERTRELLNAKIELEKTNQRMLAFIDQLEIAKTEAESDMSMAINVQENILPKFIPKSDVWDIAYYFRPMSGISGDFYDFYVTEYGEVAGLSLFDVSGHGIASGLITMLAKSIIYRHFKSMNNRNVGDILDAINEDLISELDNVPNFLSGVMLRFSNTTVEYSNAGHPDIFIRRNDASVYSYGAEPETHKGYYLGIKSMQVPHPFTTFTVEKGDTLLIFSDCLIEAGPQRGEPFGAERLVKLFAEAGKKQLSQDILDHIITAFYNYTKSPVLPDDITVIIARRK